MIDPMEPFAEFANGSEFSSRRLRHIQPEELFYDARAVSVTARSAGAWSLAGGSVK